MFILILQRLFLESILDIFYFPIWWYTQGALHALKKCFKILKEGNASLAPGLWLVNLFVPMYGQFDIQGRIVSFMMRVVQIIARGFALLIWFGLCTVLFIIWLALPVVVFYGIVYAI